MQTEDTLPNSLFLLGTLALQDGRQMLEEGKIRPYAPHWIGMEQDGGGQCTACLAGGVMLRRLGATAIDDITSVDSRTTLWKKLCAIDSMRGGHWRDASRYMERIGLHSAIMETVGLEVSDHRNYYNAGAFRRFLDDFEKQLPILEKLEKPVLVQ